MCAVVNPLLRVKIKGETVNPVKLTVFGALKSKANSRRMIRPGLVIKSKGALEFEEEAILQLKQQFKQEPIELNVFLDIMVYYPSKRSDLSPELFFDCMQKAGVLLNDRQIYGYTAYKRFDKEKPRVECTIYET